MMSSGLGQGEPPQDVERTRGPFRRIAYVLAVTAFGAGLPTPLYSLYQQQYGFSSIVLAEIFASYTVGVLLTMFFLAPQSDAIGTRPVLYIGMLLTALSGVVFIVASSILWLALARFISGLAVGATTSTATVSMTHREPRRDEHHVARVSVGANFGAVATGVLLSSATVAFLPNPEFWVYVYLIVASAVGIFFVRITPPHLHANSKGRPPIERVQVPRSVRRPFLVAVGGVAACYAIYGFFASLAPAAVREALKVPGWEAAAFVAVMFGGASLIQVLLGKVRDRNALLIGLPVLAFALVLFVLALPLASIPLLIVAGALMGIAVGYVYMGSVTLVDRVTPKSMGAEVLSGFYLAGYLALAVPTLGLAVVADRLGLSASGTTFGVALAVFVALVYFATRWTPLPPGGEGRPAPHEGH